MRLPLQLFFVAKILDLYKYDGFVPKLRYHTEEKVRIENCERQINTLIDKKCLISKNIPQVLASFFESSVEWYFQERFSSRRTPRNLT